MKIEKENTTQFTIPNEGNKTQKSVNVPNLRFSEFTNSWLKRRFGEIADFYKGTGISKDQLSLEGNECILYGELYTTYKTETIDEIKSKTNIDTKGLFFGKKNDVIIPASGETPIDIATACCVCKDNILFGGDLNIIRLKTDNGSFISCQLNEKRKIDIAKIAQGASIVHLHNDNLKNLYLYTPGDLREQTKIVALFTLIDKRIKSQSKIIEDLETLKNKFNDTLIYQQGYNKTIPLYELSTLKNGYAFKSSSYTENADFKIITIANVTGAKFCDTKKCNKIQYIPKDIQSHQKLKKNDILISLTGNVGRVSLCNEDNCLLNQRVGILELNPDVNREFIYQCLSNKKFEQAMICKGQGAAQLNIGKSDIESFDIPLFDKKYQEYVSSVLSFYDIKIQKEKEMLELYKKQKAYLLQNMFI